MNVLLLVSPSSGGGRAAAAMPAVQRALAANGWQVRTHLTRDLDDAEQVAAAAEPGTVVAALGGDGLLSRAAAGTRVSGTVLAPLPGGRGNDFCAALGVPRDPAVAAAALLGAVERAVDVAELDGRTVLGVISCGFDSEATRRANATTVVRGQLVYAWAALRTLATWVPAELTVTVDGTARSFRGYTVAVGSSGRYGGGMKIAPDARMDDGLLDVVTVSHAGRWHFVSNLPKLFSGTHVDGDVVQVQLGRQVHLTAVTPIELYADGEPAGWVPCTVRVAPGALRVLGGR
ncbi:diacylglycerol kinase family protein [Rhodococcus sp. X156]|uniref:diacylglycerol/lipid kinase family protein n=1 Tax=Rhodococcus sp. X156 TaxID=2499145 RepID=UPI0013E29927|nr:diacylglycerol kinase family protein [Rhodococcus sp. X156]